MIIQMDEFYAFLIPIVGVLLVLIYLFYTYFEELSQSSRGNDIQILDSLESQIFKNDNIDIGQTLFYYSIEQLKRNSDSSRSAHKLILISTLLAFYIALALFFTATLIFSDESSNKIITILASGIATFFSGTFFVIFRIINKDKNRLEDKISDLTELLHAVTLLEKINDPKKKDTSIIKTLEELVQNFTKRKKTDSNGK